MVSFESIDELDAAGVLTLKTHSPSTLRWRLAVRLPTSIASKQRRSRAQK